MSRIGLKKIIVPPGVKFSFADGSFQAKGVKGERAVSVRPEIAVEIVGNEISFSRTSNTPLVRGLHGLTRSEVNNVIIGVSKGFEKILEVNGVGYRASVEGRTLVLNLGFSHLIRYELPEGINVKVEKLTTLYVSGANKYTVGEVAAKIRSYRPPEPYKGKGVKYRDERIIRKEGKRGK